MELFLDTNIYLSFYKLADDDLEELQKLTVAVKSGETTLYVTQQVREEFARNREAVIADSLRAFEATRISSGFPRLLMTYPEYDTMRSALASYEKQRNALLKQVRAAAVDRSLHADGVIETLFGLGTDIPMTDEIWTVARRRYDTGNPPGKGDSYGDAVNWESLLAAVPNGDDLLFVTADSDYISRLDDSLLLDVLRQEWADKKKSGVKLYQNLTSLFKEHYPNIKLATELEKELAVAAVVGSYSFMRTHSTLRKLDQYADLSAEQARALIDAAISNDQIYRIAEDEDVYEFFTQLVIDHEDDIDPETWSTFWDIFGGS